MKSSWTRSSDVKFFEVHHNNVINYYLVHRVGYHYSPGELKIFRKSGHIPDDFIMVKLDNIMDTVISNQVIFNDFTIRVVYNFIKDNWDHLSSSTIINLSKLLPEITNSNEVYKYSGDMYE